MSERVIWLGIARVCRYFYGEGKYYTRVQCLAILPSHECSDRFIAPRSVAYIKTHGQTKVTPTDIQRDWHTAKRKLALLQTTKEQRVCKLKARVTLLTLESYLTA